MIPCALAAALAAQIGAVEPEPKATVEPPFAFAPAEAEATAERPLSLVVSDYDGRPEVWLLATRRVSRDVALDAYLLAAPDRRAPDVALGVSVRISLGRPRGQ